MNKHYSWEIDPGTGDYVVEDGKPVRDESLKFPAYARMKISKGLWLYAPNPDYGNSLSALRKRQSTSAVLAQRLIEKALEPMLNDGRAQDIAVEITDVARYGVKTSVTILDAANQNQTIELRQVSI